MKHVPVFNVPQPTRNHIYDLRILLYICATEVQSTNDSVPQQMASKKRCSQCNSHLRKIVRHNQVAENQPATTIISIYTTTLEGAVDQWLSLRVYKTSTWPAPAGSVLQSQAMQSRTDSIPQPGHKPWLLWHTSPVA